MPDVLLYTGVLSMRTDRESFSTPMREKGRLISMVAVMADASTMVLSLMAERVAIRPGCTFSPSRVTEMSKPSFRCSGAVTVSCKS